MRVILIEHVRNLGSVGDVVDVKDGYARNFLVPGKKAMRATRDNIDLFETHKKEIEKANAEKIEGAKNQLKTIDGLVVPVVMQAAEDGRLFGSVTATTIVDSVNALITDKVDRKQIVMNKPIKYIGVHPIEITLFAIGVLIRQGKAC